MTDTSPKFTAFQSVRGMPDLLPEDHDYFTLIKKAVRHRSRQAGLRRITTPILEEAALFERGLGQDTDAAGKEMYRVNVGDHEYAMKPESTAGVCRAYIQHGMSSLPQPVQLYYIDPQFRHDRPQKGRFRQFWQAGAEILGARDASIDAQLILLAHKILRDLNIADRFTLKINTIGSADERKAYEAALQDYFQPKLRQLSPESQARVAQNPLRILDSKDPDDQIIASLAPKFSDFLSVESLDYYNKVKGYLTTLGIDFSEDATLVRGLDYYCDTVFEFVDSDGLSVGGGGRYDGLIPMIGGQETPACGWALGIERIVMHLKEIGVEPPTKDQVQVYVAALGESAKSLAMSLMSELHDRGVHAVGAVGKASMRSQLKAADKVQARYTILIGDVEVREGIALLRDMTEGRQERKPLDQIVDIVVGLTPADELDTWRLGE